MAIPDFQSLMLPLLRYLGDGKEHTNQETTEALAIEMELSEADRAAVLPSGQQAVFSNRVAWAKSHFKSAGLVESTGRGVYRITERGREVLAKNPKRIDLRFLDLNRCHPIFSLNRCHPIFKNSFAARIHAATWNRVQWRDGALETERRAR